MYTLTDFEIQDVYSDTALLRAVKVGGRWLVVAYPSGDKASVAFDLFQFMQWVEDNRGKLT